MQASPAGALDVSVQAAGRSDQAVPPRIVAGRLGAAVVGTLATSTITSRKRTWFQPCAGCGFRSGLLTQEPATRWGWCS